MDVRIVTYADDLVILCRSGQADTALAEMRKLMRRLKLQVNEEKTRTPGFDMVVPKSPKIGLEIS